MEFEWDAAKEERNVRKHNVDFSAAAESFSDPKGFALMDDKHSRTEQRFYWVGKTALGKILTTRFTVRAGKIRIIGAAEWRDFRDMYHEKTKLT